MSAYTIIVSDTALLQRVCGTNDSNLKLIESFLGVPVFARGNELSLGEAAPETEQQFNFIINRILDEIDAEGPQVADRDLIQSILNQGNEGRGDFSSSEDRRFFSQCSITIPGGVRKVYPRTKGQAKLIQAMRNSDMVFATGPAGSGKTFLAVAEALRLVLSHQKSSIILTRPVVEAGESLGYLPGALEEKINPYMRPLYDSMNAVLPKETVRRMTETGLVETAPLAYMRGRTLNNAVLILDEAQNTTKEQMKMFLTRMGEGSKIFVTGDVTQIDLPHRVPSGLVHALSVLESVQGIAVENLCAEDVVRGELVKRIIQAYEKDEENE
ncbi:MAG TPA: phosphate starvation-inducible protein PhoH [Treponema sp.]|nr:phosphate starvation-inducible protein PhoH [Treponema sp.]HBB43226.1 phosphate starvation-inducible protein PhoH [Treponema sp.]